MTKTASIDEILNNGITGVSGVVYHVESEISVARKKAFDKWLVEFESGMSPERLVKEFDITIDYLNKFQMADGIYHLVKTRNNINDLSKRTDLLVKLCAIFLNTKEEDSAAFSETDIVRKTKDIEHYSYNTFFLLLIGSLPGLLGNSVQSSPNTLPLEVTDHLKHIEQQKSE